MNRHSQYLGLLLLVLPGLTVAAGEPRTHVRPQAVAEQLFDAFNRHDVDALAALYADDARIVSSDQVRPLHGPDGARAIYAPLFARFPDVRDHVTGVVAQGDHVAVEFVSRGCDRSGRICFVVPIATFLTVREGLIVADTSYFNVAEDGDQRTPDCR